MNSLFANSLYTIPVSIVAFVSFLPLLVFVFSLLPVHSPRETKLAFLYVSMLFPLQISPGYGLRRASKCTGGAAIQGSVPGTSAVMHSLSGIRTVVAHLPLPEVFVQGTLDI